MALCGGACRACRAAAYWQAAAEPARANKPALPPQWTRGLCRTASVACRAIVTGKPLPLLSKFKLSYYTLLNILRRLEGSGQDIEYVIARSFQQFQFERSLPEVSLPSMH